MIVALVPGFLFTWQYFDTVNMAVNDNKYRHRLLFTLSMYLSLFFLLTSFGFVVYYNALSGVLFFQDKFKRSKIAAHKF